jgi:hypothetical protein
LCFGSPVTRSHLDALKGGLAQVLPDVKSSHRVEALGRGLGFRTYATLRAAAQSPEPLMATVSGESFAAYLTEHGFEVDPAHLYRAAAQVAINDVLDKMPRLSIHGIGFGRPQRNPDRTWETPQQSYAKFVERRQECQELHAAEEFLLALALLSRVQPTKTVTSGSGSYRLKHIAENYACTYPEGGKLGPRYVANGMLIAAPFIWALGTRRISMTSGAAWTQRPLLPASIVVGRIRSCANPVLGRISKSRSYDTLNASFNMSKRSIDE